MTLSDKREPTLPDPAPEIIMAANGGYTEHSDALNRMPRRVSCWACHGTGKLPTCPSCKRAVAKDGKEACRFCKVRFAEAISVAP
jgi:hypothetical protein